MTRLARWVAGAAYALTVAACGSGGPPLSAADVTVYAPLPGRAESAAYLTLSNDGAADIEIDEVSSPSFERVEMHETVIVGGVARMRRLPALGIEGRSSTVLAPGGRHLMLSGPVKALLPGDTVTIEFRYGDDALLSVSAPIQTRLPDGRMD